MELQMKRLRKARGLTQEELASLIGASAKQIWAWESGKTFPFEFAFKIAEELQCSLDELAGRYKFISCYSDPRQTHINNCYSKLDGVKKESALMMMEGLAGLPYPREYAANLQGSDITRDVSRMEVA